MHNTYSQYMIRISFHQVTNIFQTIPIPEGFILQDYLSLFFISLITKFCDSMGFHFHTYLAW